MWRRHTPNKYTAQNSTDELPHLFDRFYRGDHARTTATGGWGLGLAIAKSIVDLHQGPIHAECEDTEIRFVVKLPLLTAQSQGTYVGQLV